MRTAVAAIIFMTVTIGSHAHDVPVDWSRETMPPGGVATNADTSARADEATETYLLSASDDRGAVTYRVTPGLADGSNGLFAIGCSVDGGEEFIITRGVALAACGRDGREALHDGTVRIEAMATLDLDQDGPGGFTPEPKGHGPCIRLGTAFPIAAHTEGFVSAPLDLPAGDYMIGVRYMDDADDEAEDSYIRLSVDGQVIGEWALTINDNKWHDKLFAARVTRESVLRIDARADDSGGTAGEFCRISHVLARPVGERGLRARHSLSGGILTIVQETGLADGVPPVQAAISLQGRTLRCHLTQTAAAQSPAGLSEMMLLPGANTPSARILKSPYLAELVVINGERGLFSTFADRLRSHATRLSPGGNVDPESGDASAFGELKYSANSAGEYYDFDETLFVTASPRLLDVMPTFPARRPTPGRAAISSRVVFDHWRMASGDGLERQMRIMDGCGMREMLAIWHTWMRYGYDRKQPQFVPANPARWRDEQFRGAVAACTEMGWRVAVHENYNHMDWDSPYNSPTPAREYGEPDRPGDPGPDEAMGLVTSDPGEDLTRQPRNAWAFARLADLRVAPGPLSRPQPPAFPISSDKMLFYSEIESHKIRDMYATTAGYLDVTPCNEPGMSTWSAHIDLDARNREARGFDQVYRNAACLFAHHRDIFEITTGEGGARASYHAGYIHAVERQVRTKMNTPIIPHFELTVIKPLALHHGMGYYDRYFDKDGDRATWDWDRYVAMSIAFGHAGFIADMLLPGHIPGPEAIRHYHTMRALQEAYADAKLAGIEYDDGGEWISVEDGLRREYDFTRARIRLRYEGGLELALNFIEDVWNTQVGGREFALPTTGFAAVNEATGLFVYSALTDGKREDYARNADYEYRHARDGGGREHHVVARAVGLPGLSSREAPGMLVCLSAQPTAISLTVPEQFAPNGRLNLTVINTGDEVTLPITASKLDLDRAMPALVYTGDVRGRTRLNTTWTPPGEGEWTVRLAYTYTDPGHLAEAGGVALVDQFEGARIRTSAAGPADPEMSTASADRRGNFVETAAELEYPAQARPGRPLVFRFSKLQFGHAVDDDFARDVRLILTNVATGDEIEVVFPESGGIERIEVDDLSDGHTFPANSVTTFEVGWLTAANDGERQRRIAEDAENG